MEVRIKLRRAQTEARVPFQRPRQCKLNVSVEIDAGSDAANMPWPAAREGGVSRQLVTAIGHGMFAGCRAEYMYHMHGRCLGHELIMKHRLENVNRVSIHQCMFSELA